MAALTMSALLRAAGYDVLPQATLAALFGTDVMTQAAGRSDGGMRCCARLVDGAVQVDGGALLGVDADDVGAGLGEVRHTLLRLHDHLQDVTVQASVSAANTRWRQDRLTR